MCINVQSFTVEDIHRGQVPLAMILSMDPSPSVVKDEPPPCVREPIADSSATDAASTTSGLACNSEGTDAMEGVVETAPLDLDRADRCPPGGYIPLGITPTIDPPSRVLKDDPTPIERETIANSSGVDTASTTSSLACKPEGGADAMLVVVKSEPFDPDRADPLTKRLEACLTSGTDVSVSKVEAVPELLAIMKDCHTEAHREVLRLVLSQSVEKNRSDVRGHLCVLLSLPVLLLSNFNQILFFPGYSDPEIAVLDNANK